MKKYTLLLLLFFLSSIRGTEQQPESDGNTISAEKIVEHAHLWFDQLPFLSPESTSLLANFLYFDYLASACEAAIRAALINIHTQSIVMNKVLTINEPEARKVALYIISQLKQLDEEILSARSYSVKAWQVCLNHIENCDDTDLKDIVTGFQEYGKAVLTQYIKQDKAKIEKPLQEHCTIFESRIQKLTECNTALQAILDKENPYVQEGVDRDLADADVAIIAADTALANLNDLALHAAAIKALTIDIININTFIFKTFYHVFYRGLVENNEAGSIHVMFDQNGLIETDKQDELIPDITKNFRIPQKHLGA
jgi:hypothetical protein